MLATKIILSPCKPDEAAKTEAIKDVEIKDLCKSAEEDTAVATDRTEPTDSKGLKFICVNFISRHAIIVLPVHCYQLLILSTVDLITFTYDVVQ